LTDIVEEILKHHGDVIIEHHGVKGMRWGHRKQYETTTNTRIRKTKSVPGSEKFKKADAASMNDVAKKMQNAYGHKIDEFVPIDHNKEKHIFAYVTLNNKGTDVVHVTDSPRFRSDLAKCQKEGWFVHTAPNHRIEANITHESAHSLLHSRNVEGKGFVARVKAPEPIEPMRKSAWAKAEEQARKDGDVVPLKGIKRITGDRPEFQMAKKISKYAHSSLFIEEPEAEIFTAYHWSPNPPKFVDAFMNDLHSNMGVKVQPFSGRKVSHAP
jgi:hypothetical protein